jgi:hypothetical protein
MVGLGSPGIVAFDAATATEQTRYPLDATMFPKTVATLGARVRFGYDAEAEGDFAGNFGVLEPASRVLRRHDSQADYSRSHDSPELLTSRGRAPSAARGRHLHRPGHSGQAYTYEGRPRRVEVEGVDRPRRQHGG